MRFLVDTNIAIDHMMDREPFSRSASKLITLGFLHEFELGMSSSQITDAFYLLTGGRLSLADEVKQKLKTLRGAMRVYSLTEADIDAALDSAWDDFEDACVYQCARKIKADAIITRNQKDFARSSIRVFDCDELFAYLEKEKGLVYDFIPL
ncbi:MAG TPA: PIN domain-containing protein [Candidatus Rubneribacter avistercoris]|nr:PIN domain-containing protein [Candidatus Rubneribacter avistercoris]